MSKRLLVVSGDKIFASVLERRLGSEFELHSASTDSAAFALLDSYSYDCLVVDLCNGPLAMQLNALTMPVVALVKPNSEVVLPPAAVACVNDEEHIDRIVEAVRKLTAG